MLKKKPKIIVKEYVMRGTIFINDSKKTIKNLKIISKLKDVLNRL